MYAGVAAPDQGQCVPSSPPHPRQGEQLLGRSWGQGSPRWQNRPEDPCVSTFWKSFKKLCWTHLSNWSPFKGDMPRSDGFIWWKNWLKLIPGTKYEQFLKYAALLIIPCSLSVSLSKTPISLFSQYSYVWNEYRPRYPISTKNCSKLNKKILQCQILKLTKISLALSLLAAEQTSNLDFENVQTANKKMWTNLSVNLNRMCSKRSNRQQEKCEQNN